MGPERRVPDLRIGALQLTPGGGNPAGDLVEGEKAVELFGDDCGGLHEEGGA
jgi:hypothetical protein